MLFIQLFLFCMILILQSIHCLKYHNFNHLRNSHTSNIFQHLPSDKYSTTINYSNLLLGAQSQNKEIESISNPPIDSIRKFTSSTTYSIIEVGVVFVLLSAIDGGYSGDWSRYGLISTDLESTIKSTLTNVGYFHIICAIFAAKFAYFKGLSTGIVPSALHTLLIGGLGLVRVLMQTDDDQETLLKFPSLSKSFYEFKQALANIAAKEYDPVVINEFIDNTLTNNACVMFSFRKCPYCIKAKDLLINQLGANVKIIELDEDKSIGYPIRAELGKRTNRTSVPSIWINNVFIGGCNDGPNSFTIKLTSTSTANVNLKNVNLLTTSVSTSNMLSTLSNNLFEMISTIWTNVQKNNMNTIKISNKSVENNKTITTKSGKGGVVALNEEGILKELLIQVGAA